MLAPRGPGTACTPTSGSTSSAHKQFRAQYDSIGPAALAEQASQQGGVTVDEKVLTDLLVDECGKS